MPNRRDPAGSKTKERLDISIDPDLLQKVIAICQKEERSMSNLITLSIKRYIERYEAGAK